MNIRAYRVKLPTKYRFRKKIRINIKDTDLHILKIQNITYLSYDKKRDCQGILLMELDRFCIKK